MDYLKLLETIGKCKKIKRTGWVREGIKNPESVADHSFRLAIFAMVIAPYLNLDQTKLIKMALLDDIPESKVGDIVRYKGDKLDTEIDAKKKKLEREAIVEFFEDVEGGKEYISLFNEILEGETKEAKIVKQLDKLETAMQALEYEKEEDKDLSEFFENTNHLVTDPFLRKILDEIIKSR